MIRGKWRLPRRDFNEPRRVKQIVRNPGSRETGDWMKKQGTH